MTSELASRARQNAHTPKLTTSEPESSLHNWFAYPEAFSPDFVRWAIGDYAPGASSILDPFAGIGTLPLTAQALGIRGFYCEINPLLQWIIEIKTRASILRKEDRRDVIRALQHPDALIHALLGAPSAEDLRVTYQSAFGNVEYFSDATFEQLLSARSGLDRMSLDNPQLADFAALAVVSAIVPASLLTRRGDLRFRSPQERRGIKSLRELLDLRMPAIAAGLSEANDATDQARPLLVATNAFALSRVPSLGVDAVLTSPPYLNGTNYARNTKLEMWFLRTINTPEALRSLRRQSITAGINDVGGPPVGDQLSLPASIHTKILELAEVAYDSRIPKLVLRYFLGMKLVAEGLRRHVVEGAPVLIDIGDSKYADVHVPTDELMAEVLESVGFVIDQLVHVRTRASRDGSPLRQTLIVSRAPHGRPDPPLEHPWAAHWSRFKSEQPHRLSPLSKRNWGHERHRICSFQGKLKLLQTMQNLYLGDEPRCSS